MKVNIELLKEAQRIRREHSEFCQDCGETDPPSGFYPMGISGSDGVSNLLCSDCEAKRRAPQFEGYCIRCREKRVIEDAVVSKTLRGRPIVRGVCPVCGLKMTRFISRPEVIKVKPSDSPPARAARGLPPAGEVDASFPDDRLNRDVTQEVGFCREGEVLITRCICGQQFEPWSYIIDGSPGGACPTCGRKFYCAVLTRIYEVGVTDD